MNTTSSTLPAFVAYIPVIGWLYVILFKRQDEFAMFHLRQSIGLFIFLAVMLLGWALLTWIIAWIPYGMLLGVTLFTIVITAFIFGVIAWIMGMIYALQGRVVFLPVFGRMASRMQL